MEPDRWFAVGVGMLPGVPRQVGLRFTRHETPVDSGDVIAFGDRKRALEGAAVAAGHVLGAEDGAAVLLEREHPLFEFGGWVVAVEGDDIRLFDLNSCHR